MSRQPMDDARRRKLAAFARLLTLYLSRDEVTRVSIAAMASRIGEAGVSRADVEGLFGEIEDALFGGVDS